MPLHFTWGETDPPPFHPEVRQILLSQSSRQNDLMTETAQLSKYSYGCQDIFSKIYYLQGEISDLAQDAILFSGEESFANFG